MIKDYEKIAGKIVKETKDLSNDSCEKIRIVFTDGSYLDIQGCAYGDDVEYEGLFSEYFPAT